MRWLIKCAAPVGGGAERWGDYHFGSSLAKWLKRFDQEVDTDLHGQWDNQKQVDVILVLRGKHSWQADHGKLRVLWIISHPEEVTLEECNSYHLVFAASKRHADWLRSRLERPVFPLLQCADTEYFRPVERQGNSLRADFIFVGNTRSAKRGCVIWAIESGIPLKVWGRGWEGWINKNFVVADFIQNQQLPALYSSAKVTFNDHWPDMRRCGFVNNRLFEALACGLPVISDHLDEVEELFGAAVLTYKNKPEFLGCLERLLLMYPTVYSRVQKAIPLIAEKHSFECRVRTLLHIVEQHLG